MWRGTMMGIGSHTGHWAGEVVHETEEKPCHQKHPGQDRRSQRVPEKTDPRDEEDGRESGQVERDYEDPHQWRRGLLLLVSARSAE